MAVPRAQPSARKASEPEPMDGSIPEIAAEPAPEEPAPAPVAAQPPPAEKARPEPVEVNAAPAQAEVQEVDLSDEWEPCSKRRVPPRRRLCLLPKRRRSPRRHPRVPRNPG